MHPFAKRAIALAALLAGLALPALAHAQRRGRGAGPVDERGAPVGVTVRPGYQLSLVLSFQGARFMRLAPDGTLYVSRTTQGDITAFRDTAHDGTYKTQTTFVSGHRMMQGMCWYDGWLYFSEPDAIFKARDTNNDGVADDVQTVIQMDPALYSGDHFWRSLLVYKGRIYTENGDTGNINDLTTSASVAQIPRSHPVDADREKVWSYALDGTDRQLFCSGTRNTEKMVIRPGTDEIWGMDHGSDNFGGPLGEQQGRYQPVTDFNPPEEMNHLVAGAFYGHPFIAGNKVPRYEYKDRPDILDLAEKTTPPEYIFPAHWAPNSMEFYTGDQFSGAKGDAFVAFHGSWNRSQAAGPTGYNVSRVFFDNGHPYGTLVWVNFLARNAQGRTTPLARPVDAVMEKDGSLLISEDSPGRIFRLKYVGGPGLEPPAR